MPAGQAGLPRDRLDGQARQDAEHLLGDVEGDGGTYARADDSAESLIERADRYLYQAKEAGRDRVCWEGQIR